MPVQLILLCKAIRRISFVFRTFVIFSFIMITKGIRSVHLTSSHVRPYKNLDLIQLRTSRAEFFAQKRELAGGDQASSPQSPWCGLTLLVDWENRLQYRTLLLARLQYL
ncbi:hypothetical protein EJB05_41971, partial [Eragrostis curvula]